MKIRMKSKLNKNLLLTKLFKSRWIFFKFVEQVDGVILKCGLLTLIMYAILQSVKMGV